MDVDDAGVVDDGDEPLFVGLVAVSLLDFIRLLTFILFDSLKLFDTSAAFDASEDGWSSSWII